MKRQTVFRWLQIAWATLFGLVCLLILYAWVRSYSVGDSFAFRDGHRFLLLQGKIHIDETFSLPHIPSTKKLLERHFRAERSEYYVVGDPAKVQVDGRGKSVHFAVPFLVAAALGGAPWIFRRYSLRTLLVATTLVAAILGWIVWLLR